MIKRIPGLLIGDLHAGAGVNDDGVTYIAIGPITDDDESHISIDEIEARALCAWLATSLGFALTQTAECTCVIEGDYAGCPVHEPSPEQRQGEGT